MPQWATKSPVSNQGSCLQWPLCPLSQSADHVLVSVRGWEQTKPCFSFLFSLLMLNHWRGAAVDSPFLSICALGYKTRSFTDIKPNKKAISFFTNKGVRNISSHGIPQMFSMTSALWLMTRWGMCKAFDVRNSSLLDLYKASICSPTSLNRKKSIHIFRAVLPLPSSEVLSRSIQVHSWVGPCSWCGRGMVCEVACKVRNPFTWWAA